MSEDDIRVFTDKCHICRQFVYTTDEYDDMDDPITFCDPQCPMDGEPQSERDDDE